MRHRLRFLASARERQQLRALRTPQTLATSSAATPSQHIAHIYQALLLGPEDEFPAIQPAFMLLGVGRDHVVPAAVLLLHGYHTGQGS
jgi:hypothetical protein